MKFRYHRGSLSESLATMVTVANLTELRKLIGAESEDNLSIKFYTYDVRVDADLYAVSLNGYLIGFIQEEATE